MREFKVRNSRGAEFDLMTLRAFFYLPKKLGWEWDAEYIRVGDEDYILSNNRQTRPNPSGKILFDGYRTYEEFLSFIQEGNVIFCYKPLDKWRYLDCVISVDKGEINKDTRMLECDVEIQGLSSWYESSLVSRAEGGDDGKEYPENGSGVAYEYTYTDDYAGSVTIENGSRPSHGKIRIYGDCINPTWKLYKNDVLVGTGKVFAHIISGRQLVIDSNPTTMGISERTSSDEFVSDQYPNSDFETERIFDFPSGVSSLVISHEGIGDLSVLVEVRKSV